MRARVSWVCLVVNLTAMLNISKTRGRGKLFSHDISFIDTFSTNEVSKFETFHFATYHISHVLIGQL